MPLLANKQQNANIHYIYYNTLAKKCKVFRGNEMNELIKSEHTRPAVNGAPLSAYYHDWLKFIDVKPQTEKSYTYAINHFFNWLQAHGIAQPKRDDVVQYKNDLIRDHKATTVQCYVKAVRLFFRWTASAGIYPNVADHVKTPAPSTDFKRDYLTADKVQQIIRKMPTDTEKDKRNRALFVLMVTTGIRRIEAQRANIEDLQTTAGGCPILRVFGKKRDDREDYVKLAAPAQDAINDYLKARGINVNTDGAAPLFVSCSGNSRGKRLTTRSISGIIKRAMIAAGYDSPRLTAHSLRHTAATLSLKAGIAAHDPEALEKTQQMLRHSSPETTRIYLHILDREKNNSEDRIAAVIFN